MTDLRRENAALRATLARLVAEWRRVRGRAWCEAHMNDLLIARLGRLEAELEQYRRCDAAAQRELLRALREQAE